VYNYNCTNRQILLAKYCVEQKFYRKCNATKSTLLNITLSELKAITFVLHGFTIGELWILVMNGVKMY
jgi:hypothetical protein